MAHRPIVWTRTKGDKGQRADLIRGKYTHGAYQVKKMRFSFYNGRGNEYTRCGNEYKGRGNEYM